MPLQVNDVCVYCWAMIEVNQEDVAIVLGETHCLSYTWDNSSTGVHVICDLMSVCLGYNGGVGDMVHWK